MSKIATMASFDVAQVNPGNVEGLATADFVKMGDDPFGGNYAKPTGKNQCGVCDPKAFGTDELAYNPRRMATGFIALTVAGSGLAMTSGEVVLFEEGITEAGTQAGIGSLPLTRAETDAFPGGYFVGSKDENFRIRGFGVHLGHPFRLVDGANGKRAYDAFWSAYIERVQTAAAELITMSMRHAKDSTNRSELRYELGALRFHPAQAGVVAPNAVRVGNPLARAYVNLLAPAWGGAFEDLRGATVGLKVERDVLITADPVTAVDALSGDDAYLLPISVEVYGHSVETNESREEAREEAASTVEGLLGDLNIDDPTDREILKRIQAKLRGRRG